MSTIYDLVVPMSICWTDFSSFTISFIKKLMKNRRTNHKVLKTMQFNSWFHLLLPARSYNYLVSLKSSHRLWRKGNKEGIAMKNLQALHMCLYLIQLIYKSLFIYNKEKGTIVIVRVGMCNN